MSVEVRTFACTIPAGTSQAAPITVSLAMPPRIVRRIRWRVPPGPLGSLGWALGSAGQRVIPWGGSGWIVADDETDVLELEQQITSGSWQLQGYNTGAHDHTVYLTFSLDTVTPAGPAAGLVPIELG